MALSREELLTAVEENPEAFYQLLAEHTPAAMFRRTAEMRRMYLGVPVPFFNGIAMARLTAHNCEAMIAGAIGEMNGTGMPWSWQVGPTSTPFDLATHLHNQGLMFGYDMPLMARNLDRWSPAGVPSSFESVPVNDQEAYDTFVEVALVAFGLPEMVFDVLGRAQHEIGFSEESPVRNFVGYAGGEPVSTGTVFYSHGVAGIYTISTPPDHRGKGYGSAITEACMADAKAKGFDTAFLQASKMGFSVYEKLGFQEIAKVSIYVPREP